MGIDTNPERFSTLVAELHEHSIEQCLPYPGMAEFPEGYSRFAEADAQRHDRHWQDSCPAYALALLTSGSYRLPEDDESLSILWDELGGASTKRWPEVASTVKRGWEWLSHSGSSSVPPGRSSSLRKALD